MKTKVKRLSKRSLAVFLGLVMLVTSIGLGSFIIANADTYYLWYGLNNRTNDASNYSYVSMTSNSNGTYTGSFTNTYTNNFGFFVNTSSSTKKTGHVDLSTSDVTCSSDFNSAWGGNIYDGSDRITYIGNSRKSSAGTTMYITYNPSTGKAVVDTTAPSGGGGGGGGADRLTTPTLKIDGNNSSSTVTASTSEKSTITVTNVNSYPEGTVFKLKKGSSVVATNTTGSFSIDRNTTSAGTYKVMAVPAASDNSNSDSDDSSGVTLTVNKIAAPTTPTISVDKTVTSVNGKVTITITNFDSYDLSLYDLKLYKKINTTSSSSATTSDTLVKTLTSNTCVDTANTDSTKTYAHYMVKAVAKNSTVYNDSSDSTSVYVNTQSPNWFIMGTVVSDSTWKTSYTASPLDKFYSSNVFYRVVTVANNNNYYFRLHNKTSVYGPSSTSNDEDMSSHNSSSNAFTLTKDKATKALKVSGSTTYVIFVDQSSTAPKVWVRTDLAQITISKKYQEYSNTNDTYSSATDTADDTYVSVNTDSPFIVDKNTTFSVTANVEKDGYEFLGWYSSETISDANRITTSPTLTVTGGVNENKTYYPVVREIMPEKSNVIVDENANATVTATWNSRSVSNGRTLTNVPAGATVTISGTANIGNKFSDITVKSTSGDIITTNGTKTGTSISDVTFVMPSSNVTISAVTEEYWGKECDDVFLFRQKTNGNTAYSPGDFSKWENTNLKVYYNENESDKHYYVKLPASLFTTNPTYKRYLGLSNQSGWCNRGQMFWTNETTVAKVAAGSENYINAEQRNYDNSYEEGTNYNYRYSAVWFKNSTFVNMVDYVLLDVHNGGSTGTYTYSVVLKDSSNTTSFFAKDGTVDENNSDAKYASLGKHGTTIVKSGTSTVGTRNTSYSNASVYYYTGALTKGATYTIQTTVTDNRYYVKAFNINGKSVKIFDKPASQPAASATYSFSYTVPDDAPSVIEITPVYYLYDNSNTVTFYLEGYEDTIKNDMGWGNTPYIYPYYASNDSSKPGASGGQNAFGAYSGQPMLFDNGTYSIEIPLTNVDPVNKTGGENGTNIKGITISNGWYDRIHKSVLGWGDSDADYHKQTYDYDDFHVIAEEKNPNNIYFRLKLKENRDNAQTYRRTNSSGNRVSTLTSANITDIGNNGNGWEQLKDRYNRVTDIMGNPLSGSALTADPLYVISTGYAANFSGQYGTEWMIYSKDGSSYSLVNSGGKYSIPPSMLFLNDADSIDKVVYPQTKNYDYPGSVEGTFDSKMADYRNLYSEVYNNYRNRPVYVSYEWNDRMTPLNYTGSSTAMEGPWRLDGRWYYTKDGDLINSDIIIEYQDNAGGYVAESDYETGFNDKVNKGTHTGASAYFTDDEFYALMSSGNVALDKTKTFDMKAQEAPGYEFTGWYIKHDDNYTLVTTDKTASVERSSANTYVARYKKLSSGTLKVTNTVSTGTAADGNKYMGSGNATVKVQLDATGDGTYETLLGQNVDSYTVSSDYINTSYVTANPNAKLKITLGNTPDGQDVFGVYVNQYNGKTSTTADYSYEIKLADLYYDNTYADQKTFSIDFLTYFQKHRDRYEITYYYPSARLSPSQNQKYVVAKDFSSASQVTNNTSDNKLTDAFIRAKAPKESNFLQNLSITEITNKAKTESGSLTTYTATATFTAEDATDISVTLSFPYAITQKDKTIGYNLSASNVTDEIAVKDEQASFKIELKGGYNKYLANDGTKTDETTNFIKAPLGIRDESDNVKYFSYWLIQTTKGKEVSKVYWREFNFRLLDNCIVSPIYNNDTATAYQDKTYTGEESKFASIAYLGTTRNQWNDNGKGSYTVRSDLDRASDILFNDFSIALGYNNKLVSSMSGATYGVVLEKIGTLNEDSSHNKITDMSTYINSDDEAASRTALLSYLEGLTKTSGTDTTTKNNHPIKTYILNNAKLTNKNRTEFYYTSYNSYDEEELNDDLNTAHSAKYKTNTDINVYRAYSYLRVSNSEVLLSAPTYFSMYDAAN